jgi:hypothetical protein
MTDFQKALLELDAIDTVRLELTNATKRGDNQSQLGEIHARLMSLYAALDIKNVESIIQLIKFKKAA